MKCQVCESPTETIRTARGVGMTRREVGCRTCGRAWWTVETIDQGMGSRHWSSGSAARQDTGVYRQDTGSKTQQSPPPEPKRHESSKIQYLDATSSASFAKKEGGEGGGVSVLLFPDSGSDSEKEKSKKEKSPRKSRDSHEYSLTFLQFWSLYPRTESKAEAFALWRKRNLDSCLEEILRGLRLQLPELSREKGQFAPYAVRWLRWRRWEDENRPQSRKGPSAVFKPEPPEFDRKWFGVERPQPSLAGVK